MKTNKTLIAAAAFALAIAVPVAGHAADELLNESFNPISTLPGWAQANQSTPAGQAWFQGNSGVFAAQSGSADAYIAASFLGAAGGSGSVDNWLITPVLALNGVTELSFYTRTEDGTLGYNDKLEIRFSSGSGTDTSGFSTLLATVGGAANYADSWQQFIASVDASGSGRFAFRYLGDAAALNYIGLDGVRVVTAVPEPGYYAMFCLGLLALALLRGKPEN